MSQKVITRFPPSPTGWLHVGSVRTLLFNYIFAKQQGGVMRLRIEDTDKERSKPEYKKYIYDSLEWLGVAYDGPVLIQSKRTAAYKEKLQQLISSEHAYISKEEPKEAGGRTEVIRFRNPKKVITFNDKIRGNITFDTTELGDFVIAKSIDEPLYHLTVVVDDIETEVTHVIRGEDHISNTPRQILIIEALGSTAPIYVHLPLILAADKSKLSKRKHGESVATLFYKDQGFLPEAVINFLALLGWNPGTEQEIFTVDELIAQFSLEKIQKSGAIFNIEKLRWMNREHMKRMPQEKVDAIIAEKLHTINPKIIGLVRERIETFGDVDQIKASGELSFFFETPTYEIAKLVWKDSTVEDTIIKLEQTYKILEEVPTTLWSAESVKTKLWPYAEEQGKGAVLWPLRYALSGKDKSPDPFTLVEILGKEDTLPRIIKAIEILKKMTHVG